VKALNRALIESRSPAEFAFTILPPFGKPGGSGSARSLFFVFPFTDLSLPLRAKLEKARILNELRTAHDMQMGLMPAIDPEASGFDISGMCKPRLKWAETISIISGWMREKPGWASRWRT